MKIKGLEDDYRIKDYEMVEETTYLGVTIGGRGRNIFEYENKKILDKVDRKVNTVMAEVRKSADKVIVGKAIWKQMAVPSFLFGRAVVPTCKTKIEAIQRKENKVWRHTMGIGGFSTVAALRGELGASMVKSRVMETTLQYVREVMNGRFGNIREMMLDTIEQKVGSWYRTVNSYVRELGISWTELFDMSKGEIKNMIRRYDTQAWRDNLENKSTLRYYREGKTKIGYEFCYRNNANSMFLARARANSLKLEEAIGRGNAFYNRTCKLCNQGEENLVHFIVVCPTLERKRNYELLDRRIQEPKDRLIQLLFRQNRFQETGKMIRNMWYTRKAILKYKKDTMEEERSNGGDIKVMKSDPGPERIAIPMDRKIRSISGSRG